MEIQTVNNAMTPVLSHGQANQIVGSKMQIILNNYELAVECLRKCETVSGIAGWASAAQAAECWAKLKKDDRAIEAAIAFKTHCLAEYGVFALRLKGTGGPVVAGRKGKLKDGANGWLIKQGLTKGEANAAVKFGKMEKNEFEALLAKKPGVTAGTLSNNYGSASYAFSHSLSQVVSASRSHTSEATAKSVMSTGRGRALSENTIKRLDEAIEWLTRVRSELMRLTSVSDA